MKKHVLIAALLMAGLSANAQLRNCGLAITKSGTGVNRTYTLSVPANVPAYTFNVYPNTGVTLSSTGTTRTATYTYGGYYSLYLDSRNYCTDSVFTTDTVYGPLNCGSTYMALSTNGTGFTRTFQTSYNANQPAPGYSASISYNYGDGTTGTSASHTYSNAGTYPVISTVTWSATGYPSCIKSDTDTVVITAPTVFNCANVNAAFSYTNSGPNYTFVNTTTNTNSAASTVTYDWRINGANFATGAGNKTYAFYNNGTYTVSLIATWSANGAVLCRDTATQSVNVTSVQPPANQISVYTTWDSTLNLSYTPMVKTWLIRYDSATQTLTAVDSAVVSSNGFGALATFSNKPAGSYRAKSHITNQPATATTGLLPTYGFNAAYWQNASVINHTGAAAWQSIFLQQGTPTTGNGFVGGSVVQGANRSSAAGDPVINVNILLRNNAGVVVASTLTNAQGKYQFQNVPAGTYTVYPEELNFTALPSATINLSGTGNTGLNYSFRRNSLDREFVPFTTPLGINNMAITEAIRFYPNPAQETLTLESAFSNLDVQIVSLTSSVVYRTTVAAGVNTLSLPKLAAGLYQLQLRNDQVQEVHKLLIAR